LLSLVPFGFFFLSAALHPAGRANFSHYIEWLRRARTLATPQGNCSAACIFIDIYRRLVRRSMGSLAREIRKDGGAI
jgi:hypothetical protein